MAYVERNSDGTIKGVFTGRQPGIAEEELPDDDPEVVAFEQAIEDRISGKTRNLVRQRLRDHPDDSTVSVKELKDLGIL